MNITITINTDNVAFQANTGLEVERILHNLAITIGKDGLINTNLRDINGNSTGEMIIKD